VVGEEAGGGRGHGGRAGQVAGGGAGLGGREAAGGAGRKAEVVGLQ